MALDRFQQFQDNVTQPGLDPNAAQGSAHVQIEEHGPFPADRPSYTRRFLRKAWGVALMGALGAGGLHWMSHHGAATIGPYIGDDPIGVVNGTYQFLERTVLGKQAGLDQQEREVKALDAAMQAQGVYTVRPTFTVSYYHDGAADAVSHEDGTCTIELSMDENGRMTAIGPDGGLMRSNDPEAIRNHRNYIMGHEDAHCSFHRELAPFRGSGLSPATETFLNDWVFGASAPNDHNPVRDLFNETEADVVGELVMLRAAHYSDKAWQEVEQDWRERTAKQRDEESQQRTFASDPHGTAPALREMLDNRSVVEALAPSTFRNYAYALASRSVMAQLNAGRVRAMPTGALNEQLLTPDDPLRHGKSNMGLLGWEMLLHRINPVEMRITVSEQALQMREEQLGLRTPIQGMGDTLPRRMAQQWVAQEHPFDAKVNGLPAVTFANTPQGVERNWAGKNGVDGRLVFYGIQGGAPAFRAKPAYQAFQQQVHWDAITTEIQHALNADPASMARAAHYAAQPVVIDLGLAKGAAPTVQSPPPAATARPETRPRAALPSLGQLGQRMDEAARQVRETVAAVPSVARITARRPA